MDIKVKICGLSIEDIMDVVLEVGVDMIGLMFFFKSLCYVSFSQVCKLVDMVCGWVEIVVVMVNMDLDGLLWINELVVFDYFQFYGEELLEFLVVVKVMYGWKIMKVVLVFECVDLEVGQFYVMVVDRILFDVKLFKGLELFGGNGVFYDWGFLKDFDLFKFFMFLGGLNFGNVVEVLCQSGVCELDVFFGVERDKGVKDSDFICVFLVVVKSV